VLCVGQGERCVVSGSSFMLAGPAHPGSRAVRPRRRAPGRASSITVCTLQKLYREHPDFSYSVRDRLIKAVRIISMYSVHIRGLHLVDILKTPAACRQRELRLGITRCIYVCVY
jgi:hypothetical protein